MTAEKVYDRWGETEVRENLPFPIVLYGGGSFFAFKSVEDDRPAFCGCARVGIEHYLSWRRSENCPFGNYADPLDGSILSAKEFPWAVARSAIKIASLPVAEVLASLRFEDKLCHECNGATPSLRYCASMYGSKFVQYYGWYVRKLSWEVGYHKWYGVVGVKWLPQELEDLVSSAPLGDSDFRSASQHLMRVHDDWGERARSAEAQFDAEHFSAWRRWREREGGAAFEWSGAPVVFREEEYESCFELYVKCADAWGEAKKLASDWRKAERRCRNYLENETRVRFGHNKIGDHWVGETILYHIVSRLLPERRVERHVRPDWLEGLELDIYVEELALAFEYQGIQHYEPVQHFGGEEAFIRQQKRDARKVQLCAKRDVRLIHIRYSDDLSDTYVQGRIDDVIAADN